MCNGESVRHVSGPLCRGTLMWQREKNLSSRSVTNRAVQPLKIARGLKFWIKEEEGLYCFCSENNGADQLLICTFVLAYTKSMTWLN